MRESLANALNSSDLADHEHESAIDKIRTIGMASKYNPIGTEALHAIDGLQPKSYKQILYLLVKRSSLVFKCERSIMTKICEQVIYESAFKHCKMCAGRKELKVKELLITCQVCSGTGLHRHSDLMRSKAIGVSLEAYNKGWAKKFQTVQGIFNDDAREFIIKAKIIREIY